MEEAQYPVSQSEPAEELTLEGLYKAGVHLGHLTKRWHPRMRDYVKIKYQQRHILDMEQTLRAITVAQDAVREIVANGGECLFVGTRPQAKTEIEAVAKACKSMYITSRWLGGTLTNFATITRRLEALVELEEQFNKGEVKAQTKKELLIKQAEVKRLNKFFGGIKEMTKLPDVLFVAGMDRERHAIKEAAILQIPVIAIVDSNCDPTQVAYAIPGNDDSHASISLIAGQIAGAVAEGRVVAGDRERQRQAAIAEREAQEAAQAAARAAAVRRSQEAQAEREASEAGAAPAAGGQTPAADAPAPATAATTSAPEAAAESAATPETSDAAAAPESSS